MDLPGFAKLSRPAGLLPFLATSQVRRATGGDFNIVSFGGFQMSGTAALMLTPATLDRLPADLRPRPPTPSGAARRFEPINPAPPVSMIMINQPAT